MVLNSLNDTIFPMTTHMRSTNKQFSASVLGYTLVLFFKNQILILTGDRTFLERQQRF